MPPVSQRRGSQNIHEDVDTEVPEVPEVGRGGNCEDATHLPNEGLLSQLLGALSAVSLLSAESPLSQGHMSSQAACTP